MIIKNHRSFICGVKGKVLSKKEIEFLKKYYFYISITYIDWVVIFTYSDLQLGPFSCYDDSWIFNSIYFNLINQGL